MVSERCRWNFNVIYRQPQTTNPLTTRDDSSIPRCRLWRMDRLNHVLIDIRGWKPERKKSLRTSGDKSDGKNVNNFGICE